MIYKEALKQYRKVGAAHATADSLRAMYSCLLHTQHGGKPELYFKWLQVATPPDAIDSIIAEYAHKLLRDRAAAWNVLLDMATSNPAH